MPILARYSPREVPEKRHPNPNVKRVKIVAKLELASHDGYCSGNKCDYEAYIVTYIFDWIPNIDEPVCFDWENDDAILKYNKDYEKYLNMMNSNDWIKKGSDVNVKEDNYAYWKTLLPEIDTRRSHCCSSYCEPTELALKHGILPHDYNYTIRSVKFI